MVRANNMVGNNKMSLKWIGLNAFITYYSYYQLIDLTAQGFQTNFEQCRKNPNKCIKKHREIKR